MGEVLVAVDFSDATDRVLDAVALLAPGGGHTARLIHVAAAEAELAGYDKEAFEANTPDKRAGQLRDEHDRLAELADRLRAAGVQVVEPALVMGHTADEIIRIAGEDQAVAIVVGSHGHGGLHHLLVGGATQDLLRHSPIPVVVVPAHP